ncbi:hypothetical protein HMPREF1051_0572 [Neisseria sicca VK64]|uniref:Uncharacterized protein n=1 Tax=Neisseria sicca VK64 TaxID=1095748 RepID=I2NHE5_NEISI|nr:hypothetical protein HMPREF1051_0572 [Neisseria sicca VK64]
MELGYKPDFICYYFVWVIQMKIWQVRSRAVQFCFQGLGIFNGLFVN